VGWQHTDKKDSLDVLITLSGVSAFIFAFFVQYVWDGGLEGCMKLIRRCNPMLIKRKWWVVCFFGVPTTYCILSALYVWFGGPPPPTQTVKAFFKDLGVSLLSAFLSEFGWRGMMLPDSMEVLDYWYWKHFGHTEGNNGEPIPFWANKSMDAETADAEVTLSASRSGAGGSKKFTQASASRGDSRGAHTLLPVVEEPSETGRVPHWKLSPTIAATCIGTGWFLWHLPLFFIDGREQSRSNILQYLLQAIAFSMFYTWQSNNTQNSILAAIIMHTSINTFATLVPWGTEKLPNFLQKPNCYYTLELYLIVLALVWAVGPELGRKPHV
jgi:membrane protease YdiL (CAAX protease family)